MFLGHNVPPTETSGPALPASVPNWPELSEADVIGFRPAEACDIASAWFPQVPTAAVRHKTTADSLVALDDGTGRFVDTETGEIHGARTNGTPELSGAGRYLYYGPNGTNGAGGLEVPAGMAASLATLTVSPGSVRVNVAKPSQAERVHARLEAQLGMADFIDEWADQYLPGLGPDSQPLSDEEITERAMDSLRRRTEKLMEQLDEEPKPWNVVSEFSRKSKQRLRIRTSEIDWYTPLQRRGCRIAMLTLTYPGCWQDCAGDPDTIKRHLNALEKRLARALGYPPSFVWAREFMRSGSPHFHLCGVWPSRVNGERLETWLTRNWAEIVDSGDPRHYRAGTRVDWSDGLDASDPNRLAAYFGAYASGKGSKEYQHHAPEGWHNDNGSVGRHWGARNVTHVRAELRITRAQMIEAERFLRNYLSSQKRTARTKNLDGQRSRWVNRRWRPRSLVGTQSGFTFLSNDGAALAIDIARAITQPKENLWPPGQKRPLP